ncbi:hypothetical protein HF324_18535 [Chitinophaga oryzae]|uniref:Uncharacterized protein n=1 Tax=Chitinophaga oryzae TaxID=2725414 RepID=A0ABX6LI69_9BACT|nr:hypothetical protein [Chitinophaga oryzae]QJB39747.1 hypothetical protein HF324_18535 [Chitinophaga oryzae]
MSTYLLADAFSAFYQDKVRLHYGKAGDRVKIISEHGAVLIVEDKNGNRFPVAAENVSGR